MISKSISALAIAVCLSSLAFAQGGCTEIKTWGISGYAGNNPSAPGVWESWQANIAMEQAAYGGVGPTCNYTWIYEHWLGECYSVGYTCSSPAIPPAASAPETAPGSSCPSCGRPISLASGNTYISQSDLSVPGIGGGLKLNRTWNSLWPPSQSAFAAGLFGNNWRSTYEERVFVGSDGTVKYSRSDGSFWSFIFYAGGSGVYQVIAPANAKATMTEQGTTTWTIAFQNGEQRVFDYNSGWLTAIVDRNGNTTTLSYDALSRLTTVTDAASRHLYFSYGSPTSMLVTGISSDIGLSLSYSYDSQGRLLTVTKPDQTTLSFTYDANSFISAVKDSQGKVVESHTYDTNGRGLTSSQANGVEFVSVSYATQ